MKKIDVFMSNFPQLADSVIKNFVYNLATRKIQLDIETRDADGNWCLLTMTFSEIKEVKFEEMNTSNAVIYDYTINYVDRIGYVFDFFPFDAESKCLENYRKSAFYIICQDFETKKLAVM